MCVWVRAWKIVFGFCFLSLPFVRAFWLFRSVCIAVHRDMRHIQIHAQCPPRLHIQVLSCAYRLSNGATDYFVLCTCAYAVCCVTQMRYATSERYLFFQCFILLFFFFLFLGKSELFEPFSRSNWTVAHSVQIHLVFCTIFIYYIHVNKMHVRTYTTTSLNDTINPLISLIFCFFLWFGPFIHPFLSYWIFCIFCSRNGK